MKAPYYKIWIGDRDITEYIESLDYEDTTEEDNLVTVNVDQEFALMLADDRDFVTGTIISMQFGFMAGTISELHQARMTDITHDYKERVKMTIKCLDLGTAMKKTTSQKVWENMTTSEIAQAIADKHGLRSEITPTTRVWETMPQGNRNDVDLLAYLVKRDGDGNNIVFIRNATLYLTPRGTKEDSLITYEYGAGNGVLISFTPSLKESSKDGSFNQTAVVNIDDKTGEVKASVVDAQTEENTGTTGSHKLVYGAETGEQVGNIFEDNTTAGKPNLECVEDDVEATSLANATKKKEAHKVMTAKLVVEGNPLLSPNSIITITNVAKRHIGNWLVSKVRHKISQTRYVTSCDLSSNGAKSSDTSAVKTQDNNTSEGGDRVENTVKVKIFSGEDGSFKGYSSESSAVTQGS